MVVALGPGKFYGSSLPRPRFYENPNGEQRVDPPVPFSDPFLSWAEEAHWSMGGLSFKRLRLQGRIEGNIKKLRVEREKIEKKETTEKKKKKLETKGFSSLRVDVRASQSPSSPAAPAAPLILKRKTRLVDDNEEVGVVGRVEKRGPVRKLDEDFDRVAEGGDGGGRTRSGRNREEAVAEKAKKLKRLKKGVKSTGDKVSRSLTTNVAGASPRLKKGVKSTGDKVSESVTANAVRASPRLSKSGVR